MKYHLLSIYFLRNWTTFFFKIRRLQIRHFLIKIRTFLRFFLFEENDKSKETDQEARERLVSEILGECKTKLETYVTSPLEVREVRQNMLKLSVKVGFLKVLSEHLEEHYNIVLGIAPEAWQCSEDLRKRFHDFAYRVLQAENREIDHKINDLKEAPKEMLKDVEEEFKHLLRLQEQRKYLLVQLEELRHLFLPVRLIIFFIWFKCVVYRRHSIG